MMNDGDERERERENEFSLCLLYVYIATLVDGVSLLEVQIGRAHV